MIRLRCLLAATVLLVACGQDTPAGPAGGTLEVRLTGPTTAGAALLLVEGGPIDSVEPAGYYTASAPYSGTAVRVLVAGEGLTGTLVRIWVPDRHTAYTATIFQIADGQTYQLLDPAGFTVKVGARE